MSKKLRMVLVSMLAICIGLMAMGVVGTSNDEAAILNIAVGAIPYTLDPHIDSNAHHSGMLREIFDALVRADPEGNIIPSLATSWEQTGENTWIFHLRKDVKFHNGEYLTAEDAAFSVNRIAVREECPQCRWEERITQVDYAEAVDVSTLRILTESPFATLLQGLTCVTILPKAYLTERGGDYFALNPIGTGAFKFVSFERGNNLILTANKDYWGEGPKVGGLRFLERPEIGTRLAALEVGEVDLTWPTHVDYIERLETEGFKVAIQPLGYMFIVFTRPEGPLADRKLRQAVQYAIDKEAIFEDVMLGYGRLGAGQITGPDGFGYAPAVEAYPYDPEKARSLIEESTYDGEEILYEYPPGIYHKGKEISEVVTAYLQDVGINVKLQATEAGQYFTKHRDGTLGPICIMGWQYLPALDAHLAYGSQVSGDNRRHMMSEEFDEVYAEEYMEFDLEKREKLLQELAAIWHDYSPGIPLFQISAIFAYSERLQGFNPTPDYYFNLNEVELSN